VGGCTPTAQVSRRELLRARAEEARAHSEGRGECASVWDDDGGGGGAPQRGVGSHAAELTDMDDGGGDVLPSRTLLRWIQGRAGGEAQGGARSSGPKVVNVGDACDDALVVTLVVAARGYLDIPCSNLGRGSYSGVTSDTQSSATQ
jgi:hypothetical protein